MSGRQLNYLQAIREAQFEEMTRDERVILMGEDITSNMFGTTDGFTEAFGTRRVRNTPISENIIVGAAAGAAMTGLRPIADLTIANFIYLAMDQFVNQVAKNRFMSAGQASLPVVYRAVLFYGGSNGAQHSDRPYPMFMGVPGLKVIAPTTPYDIKGMLKAAVRSDDPVICFEDSTLWMEKGEVPEEDYVVPLGRAAIRQPGDDVTVVAVAGAIRPTLAAAEELASDGVSVEVIDLRSLVPLDRTTILDSVSRTGRLVVVDPAHRTCSAASEISATVAEDAWGDLVAPIVRVTTPDVQVPVSPSLEADLYPTAQRIAAAIRRVLEPGAPRDSREAGTNGTAARPEAGNER
jgi:pyruvate dehydrogenase E1 component beta subunit